ncbi:flagellar biosynthesis protein FlhF [Fictibacillus terranigra]|uniref:Flagellar biosynthesis protein FlhF n=1 Tax=Fictibacillus terranigra TaxID=3058424 RepID=A0ABT8E684_9BACL|nr:flagellar biosynthesis protein FlhF [Fictibacillus sp. CENA-BCM004]MDN4073421.1 flagellar biosynthesis protein FlhF [Fictibacillus sp. CENA-BCM004]
MKVKKYSAPTIQEAMKKIRSELGSDAVILHTREVRTGGFMGFFTKMNIEVIALLDGEPLPPAPKQPVNRKVHEKHTMDLSQDIKELKQMVKRLSSSNPGPLKNESIRSWETLLRNRGLSETLIASLVTDLEEEQEKTANSGQEEDWHSWISEWMLSRMKNESRSGFNYETKYLNVMGPTGVGKTTTLAKLAAKAKLKDGKKVAFISTDTYRIAAIEQLKTYAAILDVPIRVAHNSDDFKRAKADLREYDLVLTDSAGRNFLNSTYVQELQELLESEEQMTNFLVLSLTSKFEDMKKTIQQFKETGVDRYIFTKMDETSSLGSLIGLMIDERISAAFITNGQNVPDDIFEPQPKDMIEMFFKEEAHA